MQSGLRIGSKKLFIKFSHAPRVLTAGGLRFNPLLPLGSTHEFPWIPMNFSEVWCKPTGSCGASLAISQPWASHGPLPRRMYLGHHGYRHGYPWGGHGLGWTCHVSDMFREPSLGQIAEYCRQQGWVRPADEEELDGRAALCWRCWAQSKDRGARGHLGVAQTNHWQMLRLLYFDGLPESWHSIDIAIFSASTCAMPQRFSGFGDLYCTLSFSNAFYFLLFGI